MAGKKYDYDEKKKIVYKIQQLKSKKKYIQLFNIIDESYKDYTTNNNGIFINLNSLPEKTLDKVEDFLDSNDNISASDTDTDSSIINENSINLNSNKINNYINNYENINDNESSSSDDFNFEEIKLTLVETKNIKS